jgi:hypothetical protein
LCYADQVPPETRARFAQSIVEEVLGLPEATCQAIRQRTGAAWRRIEEAQSVAWLDEATYNALTESIRAELGDGETQCLYRRVGRRILANPNLQSFFESVIRLSRMSPHALLKMAPRARDMVVRASGILTYEWGGPCLARLHLRDFPPSTFASGTTVCLLAGTWLGLLDAAGVGGSAQVANQATDLAAGRTTFVLTW